MAVRSWTRSGLSAARIWNPAAASSWSVLAASCRRMAAHPDSVRSTAVKTRTRSEEHTSELQSQSNLVCRLLLEKKKKNKEKHLGPQHHRHERQQTDGA